MRRFSSLSRLRAERVLCATNRHRPLRSCKRNVAHHDAGEVIPIGECDILIRKGGSVSDVAQFLDELGLSQYCPAFLENAVGYELLADLSDSDLRELGVEALGHRKMILRAAAEIASRKAEEAEPENRAQRRQLTLMFADLADSTQLSDHLELEAYNEIIRAYQDTATQAIEAHGGYVAKYIGDGVLAYFGYPKSHEDDTERAIRAGKALIEQVSRLDAGAPGGRLGVRVGIETGPVVVGEIIGEASAQEHAVVGKTPNLAARLQAMAEPNTVVVGPVAHRLAGVAATFHALGEHDLKGFDAPVRVWRIDAVSGTTDPFERERTSEITPLIGRRRELGALASAFARMRSGEELIVHLVGEPGIGKSRLIREFLAQISELAIVLAGHCASQGGSTAFFPFINLLRTWLGKTDGSDTIGADWMDRLVECGLDAHRHAPYILKLLDISHPAISKIEPDLIGVRTQEALTRFVIELGRVRPTVLFINDLHWIDERSATLLDALARSGERQGVLVLTTFRRRYVPPWHEITGVEEVSLAPLSAAESLSLFQSRVVGDLADDDLSGIVERAGGNPLFLEELARHVALASGKAGEEWGAAIPETLAGLLMQRVDALSSRARRAAETAAVAGRRFNIALLGEGAEAALMELQAGSVVISERGGAEGAYRFHHALVHDVIYDSLLEADRRHLHREVGARLETNYAGREVEVAEDLARHFEVAGDTRLAMQYAYRAGTKALDLFALRDAETWYGKCLSFASSEDAPEDDLFFARTVVNQTQVLCWNGDFPAMMELAQRHLSRIQAIGVVKEASQALTWIGEGYMHVGRYEDARDTLGQALDGGRALGDETCIGYASGELMWLDTIVGEGALFEGLPDRVTELEALACRVDDRYLNTLAHYVRWAHATQSGRVGAALETARRLRAYGENSSYPPAVCWGACLEADGHAKAGNVAEAEQAARAGRDAAACGFDLLMADLALGMTLVTAGCTEDGLALLKKAPWRTDRIGALYFAYAGDVAFGRALADAGQVKEGLDWLRDGIEWFERIGNHRAACMTALELARILIEDTDQTGPREGFRLRLRTLFAGATSPVDEARACLGRVLAARQALSMHGVCAEALMLRARLAERDNDFAATRAAHAEAHSLAASLEWLPLMQQINAEIRRLGTQGDQ
jgi:class 3 adenylate cyclase/tetratricopeptide (TPR) repeat protein